MYMLLRGDGPTYGYLFELHVHQASSSVTNREDAGVVITQNAHANPHDNSSIKLRA